MNQFVLLMKKEWLENNRSYKLYWIPVLFILLGITEPVVNYFLPQILEASGGMPDGAVFEIPTPTPEQVLIAVMGQFQTIGIAVLILAYMGTVAGERRSGTATLFYVRPLSFGALFFSKWTMASLVSLLSVWIGFLAGYYYTFLFFGPVAWPNFLGMIAIYSVWVVFVVTLVVVASAALPNSGLAAAVAFGLFVFFQLMDSLVGMNWTISPVKLPEYSAAYLSRSLATNELWGAIGLAGLIIMGLCSYGVWAAQKNKAKTKV